jgi:hypothetical protein
VGAAFAYVDRQWVECHSEYYPLLHGHSEREVHLASEELRKRRMNHSVRFGITARKLADFLESVEVEEAILIQRLSDLEARSLDAPSQPFPVRPVVSAQGSSPVVDRPSPGDLPVSYTTYGTF